MPLAHIHTATPNTAWEPRRSLSATERFGFTVSVTTKSEAVSWWQFVISISLFDICAALLAVIICN